MGIGFGNGGGMKGRNRDWKIKSNSFVIGKNVSCMSKMNFIIWSYLEDSIRVGESKNLLKTHTHRCEPAEGGSGNLNRDCFAIARNDKGEVPLLAWV
jgi:hypothetical protein